MPTEHPTPHADVNTMLAQLHADIRHILSDNFVGMYLYGSLTGPDFDPDSSDIDFLVVVEREVRGSQLDALVAMHQTLFDTGPTKWARELEASYIPRRALRRYDPADIHHPHIDRGSGVLAVEQHDVDWVVQRWVLREQGITIAGPPIMALIDPVSADDLRRALITLLDIWWVPMCHQPGPLEQPGYRSYAVLSMCRILYTFTTGTITSKPTAAGWAAERVEDHMAALIEQATRFPNGSPDITIDRVQSFILYADQQIRALWAANQRDSDV